MTTPRVEIDLTRITENTRSLVDRLAARRITVTGVTKAVCGHPDVARAMLKGGAVGLADARVSNVLRLREAGITAPISLIRAPMQGDIDRVVQCCDSSYNTEADTIEKLAAAARLNGVVHDVVLMVEMGDNREGILPDDLAKLAAGIVTLPGLALKGIAANFACLGNTAPTAGDMALLSRLADAVDGACGPFVDLVSAGGSANLLWALSTAAPGRINNLRLGEAILLGVDPVTGRPIEGLHLDAFTFVAEVIETSIKLRETQAAPRDPAPAPLRLVRTGDGPTRSVLAVGQQDTDTCGLVFREGIISQGATSDHTVICSTNPRALVGSDMTMGLNYSALMRAMSAPDVAIVARPGTSAPETGDGRLPLKRPVLT
ncbi:alanine racemase [Marinovum sp.]|uniref:alanine racemase n=1 Tax=Marinovum sp. TaxID=2024839 RepID=UPI003A953C6D